MALGLNAGTGGLAKVWLDMLNLVDPTVLPAVYVQLHKNTGEPGAAGTSNISAETTRKIVTFGASSAGVTVTTGTAPSWTSWPAPANGEVINAISLWTASSAGTFLASITLTTPKTMTTGDTLTLTTGSTQVSLTPIAS